MNDKLRTFLSLCTVESIDMLSDEQVMSWMLSKNVSPTTRCIFEEAMNGGFFGDYPREDALSIARESMKTGKEIWAEINIVEGSFDESTEGMEESYKLFLS